MLVRPVPPRCRKVVRALSRSSRLQLEREVMLNPARDPFGLALTLLSFRQSTDPYVQRRMKAWSDEVCDLLAAAGPCEFPLAREPGPGGLLSAILLASGQNVKTRWPETLLPDLLAEIRQQGVGRVAAAFEEWLLAQQQARGGRHRAQVDSACKT